MWAMGCVVIQVPPAPTIKDSDMLSIAWDFKSPKRDLTSECAVTCALCSSCAHWPTVSARVLCACCDRVGPFSACTHAGDQGCGGSGCRRAGECPLLLLLLLSLLQLGAIWSPQPTAPCLPLLLATGARRGPGRRNRPVRRQSSLEQ